MALLSNGFRAVSDAVLSQVSHGKPAEITLDPSSQHGHQGNIDIFILTEDNAKFVLFRSSHDLTYIYGQNDFAAYYGCGNQTVYDFGTGTHFQFSEITAPIKVYGLEHDGAAVIDLFNAAPGTSLHSDGHGGTLLGNIDFIGATVAPSQINFLSSYYPLSMGGFPV
jgi:hypothetical protein